MELVNPTSPQKVLIHDSQDEYLRLGPEYFGWATYLLNPIRSRHRA